MRRCGYIHKNFLAMQLSHEQQWHVAQGFIGTPSSHTHISLHTFSFHPLLLSSVSPVYPLSPSSHLIHHPSTCFTSHSLFSVSPLPTPPLLPFFSPTFPRSSQVSEMFHFHLSFQYSWHLENSFTWAPFQSLILFSQSLCHAPDDYLLITVYDTSGCMDIPTSVQCTSVCICS